jgi:DNA-binding MltR family transcriptional regulator
MARSGARRLLDELPSSEEMAAAIEGLRLMDDANLVLMSVGYLDYALELLLKAQFIRLTNAEEKRLFDGSQNAMLGTFSSKIRIAYAVGLLLSEIYTDLLIINDIRNAFAHSLHREVYFTDDHIIEDCKKLLWVEKRARLVGEPIGSFQPALRFVETVQHIYAAFRRIADDKQKVTAAMQRVYSELESQQSASVAPPPPSPRKPRQRGRSNPPILK